MRSEEAVDKPAGLMGVNRADIAVIRKARLHERAVTVLRPAAYLLFGVAGFLSVVAFDRITSSNSPYPYVMVAAAAAGVAESRPRWKTPVYIIASYLVGFFIAASSFSVVVMYSVASNESPRHRFPEWIAPEFRQKE